MRSTHRMRNPQPLPTHPPRRGARALVAVTAAAVVGAWLAGAAATPRFFDDDPIARDDDTVEDASGAKPWPLEDVFDLYANSAGDPSKEPLDLRAQNLNTIDEVPDSSWFTNRVGSRTLSADELETGGWTTQGPVPGPWTIIQGKSDGRTPGFTITDPSGERWILKFDADEFPGMASGSEVTASRLFWALGYNVPEYHIVIVSRDQLRVGPGARVQPPGAYMRDMRESDVDLLLGDTLRSTDGTYRAVASRALPGTPLGGFRFHGTRPDDPNDVVPHEHRRELRALEVFSGWLNHVEVRGSNTLDTLVPEGDRRVVRHNLLDFGATLGSGTLAERAYWEGHEYEVDPGQALRGLVTFGFPVPDWRRVPLYESDSVGRLPADHREWDPASWKPRVSNSAFRRARADDRFWAARKLQAMSDDLIRTAVLEGLFPDAEGQAFLVRALSGRRDAILRTYLPGVLPVVDPALDDRGTLTFGNAAANAGVAAAPASYEAAWFVFDNATGESRPLGTASGTTPELAAPAPLPTAAGAFVRIELRATAADHPAWGEAAQLYFRRTDTAWRLVGLERQPRTSGAAQP